MMKLTKLEKAMIKDMVSSSYEITRHNPCIIDEETNASVMSEYEEIITDLESRFSSYFKTDAYDILANDISIYEQILEQFIAGNALKVIDIIEHNCSRINND